MLRKNGDWRKYQCHSYDLAKTGESTETVYPNTKVAQLSKISSQCSPSSSSPQSRPSPSRSTPSLNLSRPKKRNHTCSPSLLTGPKAAKLSPGLQPVPTSTLTGYSYRPTPPSILPTLLCLAIPNSACNMWPQNPSSICLLSLPTFLGILKSSPPQRTRQS